MFIRRRLNDFLADEGGATAIEYGLIVALLGLAIVGTLETMGVSISGFFDSTSQTIDGVTNASP